MSKRTHTDITGGAAEPLPSPGQKRAKTSNEDVDDNTLAVLIADADKFLHVFETLKSRKAEQHSLKPQDLDSNTRKTLKALANKVLPISATLRQADEEIKKQPPQFEPQFAALPSRNVLTKWTEEDIPRSLPPLPPVLDKVVEAAAFTHSGKANRPGDLSYERLEWLGDSYIMMISCSFIYATFPSRDPGKMSQLRERLVKNSTLAEYSVQYGFDKRANFPAEFGLGGRPGGTQVKEKERMKAIADMFEAYVAAVVLSDPEQGFAHVSAWLKALWAGTISKEIRDLPKEAAKQGELPAKGRLATMIVAKGVKLRYEDAVMKKQQRDRHTSAKLFTINCYLDGWGETDKLIGWGSAQSKKEAGEKAAQCAIDNKKLMATYVAKKKEFMAAQEAQQKEE
jgi:ribonuclease-3